MQKIELKLAAISCSGDSDYEYHINTILTVLRELVDAHNESLETHTVKEVKKLSLDELLNLSTEERAKYYFELTPPSNSEKEECKEATCMIKQPHSRHKEEVKEEKGFILDFEFNNGLMVGKYIIHQIGHDRDGEIELKLKDMNTLEDIKKG